MPLNGTAKDIITIPVDRNKVALPGATMRNIFISLLQQWWRSIVQGRCKTKQVDQLTDFNSGVISFDITSNKLVYVKTEPADPYEVYLSDANAKNAKRISSFNYDWIQKKQLSIPEKKTFINDKGMTVEYWVMKPDNYAAGKKFPLLLNIHGGPSAMWGTGRNQHVA